jgi:hypothetical protein
VRVHGSWHGSWCWSATVRALRAAGHRATAVHLPSDRVGAGGAEYADTIAAAADPAGSVVVGHSLAGLSIPLVPERANVTVLVYLAAFLPGPGEGFPQPVPGPAGRTGSPPGRTGR